MPTPALSQLRFITVISYEVLLCAASRRCKAEANTEGCGDAALVAELRSTTPINTALGVLTFIRSRSSRMEGIEADVPFL
jgi:hypothetical protein